MSKPYMYSNDIARMRRERRAAGEPVDGYDFHFVNHAWWLAERFDHRRSTAYMNRKRP